jgi:hypothetical protein
LFEIVACSTPLVLPNALFGITAIQKSLAYPSLAESGNYNIYYFFEMKDNPSALH